MRRYAITAYAVAPCPYVCLSQVEVIPQGTIPSPRTVSGTKDLEEIRVRSSQQGRQMQIGLT